VLQCIAGSVVKCVAVCCKQCCEMCCSARKVLVEHGDYQLNVSQDGRCSFSIRNDPINYNMRTCSILQSCLLYTNSTESHNAVCFFNISVANTCVSTDISAQAEYLCHL